MWKGENFSGFKAAADMDNLCEFRKSGIMTRQGDYESQETVLAALILSL